MLENELRQVIYEVLLTQIQFGIYRFGAHLPSIEAASEQFLISRETARSAYHHLKQAGYISLSKNAGAIVQARFDEPEIQQHIHALFAQRRNALTDLSESLSPLLGHAQWVGLKHASPETLLSMEKLVREGVSATYALLPHLKQKYAALGNDLLMRLVWQIYMFFHAPFFSISENLERLDACTGLVPSLIRLCRCEDWAGLRTMTRFIQNNLTSALRRFLAETISTDPQEQESSFCWSSYKRPDQLCYSIAMELLIEINQGVYPPGSLMPTLEQISKEKAVSVSTARRAMSLLGHVGAVKAMQRVGTRVLPVEQCGESCNLTHPTIRQRLLDMAQSLQILTLSCKEVAQITVAALNASGLQRWKGCIREVLKRRQYDSGAFAIMELISDDAPYQTLRTVYGQLLRQLFWAHALRNFNEHSKAVNELYKPYFQTLIADLETADPVHFSTVLEELMLHELCFTVENLIRLGIRGAERILIPDPSPP